MLYLNIYNLPVKSVYKIFKIEKVGLLVYKFLKNFKLYDECEWYLTKNIFLQSTWSSQSNLKYQIFVFCLVSNI